MTPRIIVFGAGAIGSALAVYLSREDRDLLLIDPWYLQVRTIQDRGISVKGIDEEFRSSVKALLPDELEHLDKPADILILAVKSYDTEWALRLMLPYVQPDAPVLSAQNGLNEEKISSILGPERTVGCVVTMGGAVNAPGHVMRTSSSKNTALYIGELNGESSPRCHSLAELLSPVGGVEVVADIQARLWSKLAVNCMSNSISGLTGMSAGEWRLHPLAQRVGVRIAVETASVARAHGIKLAPLPGGMTQEMLLTIDQDGLDVACAALENHAKERFSGTGEGRPSLLQDVSKGRRTEVRYLNGMIVRKAAEVGIETPVNAVMVDLIEKIEMGELASNKNNLNFLKKYV